MSNNHKLYELALRDKHQYPVIAYGSAGTGKTYGAVAAAYEALSNKSVRQILVVRPNESFAKTTGFLPGTAREKMDPWVKPVLQNFRHFCNPHVLESWEKNGNLQFQMLEHIQGLTWDNTFIIVDECQNMTFDQYKVLLTRIGKYSKLVLCGDIRQTSPYFRNGGLAELLDMVEDLELPIHTIEFGPEDIVRSEQCKMFINAFEAWETVK